MRKLAMRCAAAAMLLAGGIGQVMAGTVYDAAADFSPTSNPNGVWSYGSATLSSLTTGSTYTFSAYTNNITPFSGIQGWGASAGTPSVTYNPTGSAVTVGTVIWAPGELAFHPGSDAGSVSIVEFTAPTTSYYNVAAIWQTDDTTGPASSNLVAYGINGVLGGTAPIGTAFHTQATGNGKFLLNAGDTFDFMIYAQTYGFNTTGIAATVTAVPEPSSFALVGLGGLGLALGAYRRRRATAA